METDPELKHKIQMRNEGRTAFHQGARLDQNPYPKKSNDAWDWKMGWLHARNDYEIDKLKRKLGENG